MPPDPVIPKLMPFEKYKPFRPLPLALSDREWPSRQLEKAPIWCWPRASACAGNV